MRRVKVLKAEEEAGDVILTIKVAQDVAHWYGKNEDSCRVLQASKDTISYSAPAPSWGDWLFDDLNGTPLQCRAGDIEIQGWAMLGFHGLAN